MGWRDFLPSFSGSKRVAREKEEKSLVVDLSGGEPFYDRRFLPQSVYGTYTQGYDVLKALYSNVVMAPVFFIQRSFTEAEAVVQTRRADGVWKNADDHALQVLIDNPNPAYGADELWKATILGYVLDGNSYWLKVRNRIGEVIELWYLPHWLVRPEYNLGDTADFISHYSFTPTGMAGRSPASPNEEIAPRDIVHFRFGLDPENPRLGLSPLRTLLKELFTDDEAAVFTGFILQNSGVPGIIVSPKDTIAPEQVTRMKTEVDNASRGANRGSTLVFGRPTELKQYGFDPNQLMLGNLRDIVEERVCAVTGIPAAVVGFGSGLQQTKVGATMRENVRLAWNTCLIPMQKTLAKQLTRQLLPDFVSQTRRFRAWFDTSDVSAFQEEIDIKSTTVLAQVAGGVLRVDRGQEALGLEVDPNMKVYYRPTNVTVVGEDGEPIEAPVPPATSVTPGTDSGDGVPDPIANRMNGNGATNGNGKS